VAQPAVQVQGARTLRRTLKAAGIGVQDLKAAHAKVAEQVEVVATYTAPWRTGRLAGSLRSSGTKTAANVRAGGARIPYAGPIHWGWPRRNIKPQPFISKAAEETRTSWEGTYLAALDAIIRKIEGAPGP
jgi:hypothetical protein